MSLDLRTRTLLTLTFILTLPSGIASHTDTVVSWIRQKLNLRRRSGRYEDRNFRGPAAKRCPIHSCDESEPLEHGGQCGTRGGGRAVAAGAVVRGSQDAGKSWRSQLKDDFFSSNECRISEYKSFCDHSPYSPRHIMRSLAISQSQKLVKSSWNITNLRGISLTD